MPAAKPKAKTRRAVSTPPAAQVEDSTAMGQVLDLLQGMNERLNGLEAKVKEQDRAIPKFQQVKPEGAPTPNVKDLTAVGQSKRGGKDAIVAIGGLIMPGYRPNFSEGDRVRLNPDCEQGRTLRNNGKNPEQYVGTIVGFHYVDKNLEAKYRVDFPGLTRGTRGDGFRESDLLPV